MHHQEAEMSRKDKEMRSQEAELRRKEEEMRHYKTIAEDERCIKAALLEACDKISSSSSTSIPIMMLLNPTQKTLTFRKSLPYQQSLRSLIERIQAL